MIKGKPRILSTKKLQPDQRDLLTKAGLSVLDKDFINISFQKFSLKALPEVLLFTSQNAVKSVLKNNRINALKHIPCICVGAKTKRRLEQHHFKVLFFESYAKDLSIIINKYFPKKHLAFFSGNRRMRALPEFMTKNKIRFDEYTVYKTKITPENIRETLDGLLFFSPSGIAGYLQKNRIADQKCFCIGTTTAGALSGITERVYIAEQQTVESTLKTCLTHFKSLEC